MMLATLVVSTALLQAPALTLTALPKHPLGTLREQAAVQQDWLRYRLDSVLPRLMRQYKLAMWVVPMREYNEDPVFWSLVSATSFFARRRTIYVFFDRGPDRGVERLALGGTSQGGLYEAYHAREAIDRSTPRAGGTSTVGSAAQGDRGARPANHRRRHLAHARLLGRVVGGRVGAARGRASRAIPVSHRARRGPTARVSGDPRPGDAPGVPAADAGRLGNHRYRVLEQGHHARQDDDRRRRLVDAPAGERPRVRHLVPHRRGCAAAGRRPIGFRRRRDPARRRVALRLRNHRTGPEHRHAAHGLRAATR